MKLNRIVVGLCVALLLTLSVVAFSQVNRPYRNGTVWSIGVHPHEAGNGDGLPELHCRRLEA